MAKTWISLTIALFVFVEGAVPPFASQILGLEVIVPKTLRLISAPTK